MSIYRILFPRESRSFPGRRWVNIALRTLHLIGNAGVGAGFLFGAPEEAWLPYLALTVASGFALLLLEIWANVIWLIHICGAAILVKLGLFACLPLFEGYEAHVLVITVVISGISSHAPRDIRHISLLHGKRVDAL